MLTDLDRLATKLDTLLTVTDRLAADNASLRAERDALIDEQHRLNARIADAQARIEAILAHLPARGDGRQLELLIQETIAGAQA